MELMIEQLERKYGEKTAVANVSLTLHPGVYGLLGANGAGKTTLMRMLCGILKPTSGRITYDHMDVNSEEYRARLGYLPQDFGYYPEFSGQDFLMYLAALKGLYKKTAQRKVKELLELVSLSEVAKKKIKTYSGGMKQRLGIAQALLKNTDVLVLDEPTNGLDPAGMKQIRSLLRTLCTEYGTTIMVSSHILSEIESIADTVGVIHRGRMRREIAMKEIEQMSLSYRELSVQHREKASYVLTEKLGLTNFKVMDDGLIRIYDTAVPTQEIAKALALANVQVLAIGQKAETLEDYFMKLCAKSSAEMEKTC